MFKNKPSLTVRKKIFHFSALVSITFLLGVFGVSHISFAAQPVARPSQESQLNEPALTFSKGDSFQISESGCMSGCPSYSITIFGDGTFQFQERIPQEIPVSQGRLTPALFNKFSNRVKSSKLKQFSMMRKDCKELASDHATLRIGFQSSGVSYNVNHNLGCVGFEGESDLIAFENEIKAILGISDSSLKQKKFVDILRRKK